MGKIIKRGSDVMMAMRAPEQRILSHEIELEGPLKKDILSDSAK